MSRKVINAVARAAREWQGEKIKSMQRCNLANKKVRYMTIIRYEDVYMLKKIKENETATRAWQWMPIETSC